MNAYELADDVKYISNTIEALEWVQKASPLLRQQADRIAELEKDLALKIRDRDVFREFTLAYEKRIAELEKPIQDGIQSFGVLQEQMLKEKLFGAEPVAWTNQKWLDRIAKEPQLFQPLFVHGKQTEHNTIPLYTTPQIKELSDAEISEISHRYHYTYNPDYVGFARAILKKVSEK